MGKVIFHKEEHINIAQCLMVTPKACIQVILYGLNRLWIEILYALSNN